MKHYEFTLRFAVPANLSREAIEQQLYESDCDDALVGSGQRGRLALLFSRSADRADNALMSAIRDVMGAIPAARLIEVSPDLVGVSDIAEIFSFSRQNMRKLIQSHIETFPLPVHEGSTAIWHLDDILGWFTTFQHKRPRDEITEVAHASRVINQQRFGAEHLRERPAGA